MVQEGNGSSSVDIWRDTPLRYLGYANECGEAFGPLYPRFIRPSYVVAFAYVGCDTVDKAWKAKTDGDESIVIAKKASDALIWQTLASVLIPGKVIHMITHQTHQAMSWQSIHRLVPRPLIRQWIPTCVGLSCIPFIIHPIDHGVDFLMDHTVRKYLLSQASSPQSK